MDDHPPHASAAVRGPPRSPRRRLALVLAAGLLVPGCANYREHLVNEHPWHSVPTFVGVGVGLVGTLPLWSLEDLLTGSRFFPHMTDPGPVGKGCACLMQGLGLLLGTPFYLLGLPFEGGGREEAPPQEPGDRPGPGDHESSG